MRTDHDLIRGFRRGDAGAFRELYFRWRDRAYFYALALSADEGLADDVVQEAFLAFLRNLSGYEERGSFRAYLFAAVRSRAIDALRREGARKELASGENLDLFEAPRLADPMARGDLTRAVGEALLALPPEQREVVVLKVYDGLTFREIAEIAGENPGTVASRWRYACEKLGARLAKLRLER